MLSNTSVSATEKNGLISSLGAFVILGMSWSCDPGKWTPLRRKTEELFGSHSEQSFQNGNHAVKLIIRFPFAKNLGSV